MSPTRSAPIQLSYFATRMRGESPRFGISPRMTEHADATAQDDLATLRDRIDQFLLLKF